MKTKQLSKLTLASILIFIGSSCSHKAIYNNIQLNQKNTCLGEPNTQVRKECLEGSDHEYRDYKRERDKLLTGDK